MINQLKKDLQERTIEVKMYAQKLKIIREENSAVRMQLFDPSSLSRKQREQKVANVPNYKDELIVDFDRIEHTHDTVQLQEEIKDLHTETAVLKERIATLQNALEDKENAQIELVNRL